MKIFIFGAGASRDAQHRVVHDNAIPPLTNELFDQRYSEFARIVGLLDPAMSTYRNQAAGFGYFEDWLTHEWEKIQTLKTLSSRDAQKGFLAQILFYIWLILINASKWTYENQHQNREDNAYVTLMYKILNLDEEFGLINFNYDLLLDYAYKDVFRLTFHRVEDYLNNNYVKPHGSVNWLLSKRDDDLVIDLDHEHNMDTRVRLDTAIKLMYRDVPIPMNGLLVKEPNHRDLYTIDDLLRSFSRQYFYPLIFLPLTSKVYSSIAGFEDAIIKKGNQLMSKATEIYLIGYRANDSVIKEMLQNIQSAQVVLNVVGMKSSAEEIMQRVLGMHKNLRRGKVFDKGFYNYAYDPSEIVISK